MKSLANVLSEHFIAMIECDHENKRDRAICNCAKWEAPWRESPVEAAKAWAWHVQQEYDKKAGAIALTYVTVIEPIRAAARAMGYAIGVHGSLARDIDLIAVPWADDVADANELIAALRTAVEEATGHTTFVLNDATAKPLDYTRRSPEPKAHGRLGWSIHIAGLYTYVDLSVMPAGQAWTDAKIAELQRKLDQAYDAMTAGARTQEPA